MKFNEYKYEHLDVKKLQETLANICSGITNSKTYEEYKQYFKELNDVNRQIITAQTLVEIRHTINTQDEFYTKENDFLNEMIPVLQESVVNCNKAIMQSEFVEDLKKDIPETYFLQREMEHRSFDPKIIPEMQEENKLCSKYQSIVASAQIEFDGQTYTLAALEVKTNDKDRDTRKRAMKAYWGWYEEHAKEIGDVFDQLVKVRTKMAKKLGYDNFIELGYYRMQRFDYNQEDVENYRKQVLEDVVPFDNELYARQQKRLGYDTLHAWDEKYEFLTGNPTPKYDRVELVKRALKMYQELDPKTGEFFQFMTDHELLDLDAKPGKAAGGYCTFIPNYESPFIFANFNHTSGDAEVLTHEAGHAFQCYSSKNIFPIDCVWPTSESCEIHSMSMEFFTYPWMKSFFEEDTEKYYFKHLSGTAKFLPYGVLVDHFQHEVYAHPDMTPEQRMTTWRNLEKQYLPHKNYEEIDILEKGGWWMRQLHIFMYPFYYIDYTLAQVCAMQFWARIQKKDPKAFENYKHICEIGGTLPFKKIVKEAGLKVPFESGCLKETMEEIRAWFNVADDSKF